MAKRRPILRKVAQVMSTAHPFPSGGEQVALATASGALNIVRRKPISGTPSAAARAGGLGATPAHNLRFRGGRTIQHLTYVNLFVGGSAAWAPSDIQNIDRALSSAMGDSRLDEVINQYFTGGAVSTTASASQILTDPAPKSVSRATIDSLVRKHVVAAGRLNPVDPRSTVFNFMLPRGVILTTTGGSQAATAEMSSTPLSVETVTTVRSGDSITTITVSTSSSEGSGKAQPSEDGDNDGSHGPGDVQLQDPDDAASSLAGLGGYHGSVHVAGTVIYFAVGVFSEALSDGSENGIVAFPESWKNVVATFYHELQEARTDPDVEDAIRTNNSNFIGWNSDQGEEIGDFPVFEADPLQEVFKEVPLVGGGTVPIQLMYSNRVNGPEDPTT